MDRDMSVAIVGGSLVGPLAYLMFRKAGFDNVDVYEEMPTPESRSGGVMGVRYPVIEVLENLSIDRRDIRALRDTNVYAYDISHDGVPVTRGASEFPGIVTSWDALHSRLMALVPDIKYRHTVHGIREVDGKAFLYITRRCPHKGLVEVGRSYDLVVFADGRKSTGRELLDSNRRLEYQHYVVWRGLSDPPRPVPSGFNRYYNIDGGKLFSVTEPIIQNGKSYWELSHNLDRATWEALAGGSPEERAYLLPKAVGTLARETVMKALHNFPKSFQDLVDGAQISGIPVNDTRFPNRAAFPIGNSWAVLLGDALIPVRLQVGAGLNQGLLEAQRLVNALTKRDDSYMWRDWEGETLEVMAKWVELGRSRVGRTNLGKYTPVRPGKTAVALSDSQWDEPEWVAA
jgi:2-polyprenyl-6-methoxyphenol hydroxylase-like FAD-dependent oxidoreductase